MTKLADATSAHVASDMGVWYIFSPPSGASTAISATSSSGTWLMWGVSYAGTDVTAFGTTVLGTESPASGNHAQFSISTANANSWVFMALQEQGQNGTLSSGTNTTNRGKMGSFPGCGGSDSGLLASSGAVSLDIGVVTSGYVLTIMAEMKVAGGGGGGTNWGPSLLSDGWNRIVQP
jgi:hypothetical protein